MAKRQRRYPYDITPVDIPIEALERAKEETFRFLFNYSCWEGDLKLLCALCYLQGVFDGAQVATNNEEVRNAVQG